MKDEEVAYEVPRSVWRWATAAYTEATCVDIWQFIFLRQSYHRSIRRTLSIFIFSVLISIAITPVFWLQVIFISTLCVYLINSRMYLKHLQYEIMALQARNQSEWLEIVVDLVPLLNEYKRSDPRVSVLVRN